MLCWFDEKRRRHPHRRGFRVIVHHHRQLRFVFSIESCFWSKLFGQSLLLTFLVLLLLCFDLYWAGCLDGGVMIMLIGNWETPAGRILERGVGDELIVSKMPNVQMCETIWTSIGSNACFFLCVGPAVCRIHC